MTTTATHDTLHQAVQRYLAEPQKRMLINGQHVTAQAGRTLPVYNPATGEVIAHVPDAGPEDVDLAVQSAQRVFESQEWQRTSPAVRELRLLRLAELIEQHAEELAQLETLEQGKLLMIARHVEVAGTVAYARYMAGWATKIEGTTNEVSIGVPIGARYFAYTRREPVGVVAAIVPWNFPLMMAIWKVAPALACGCTVVLKPAEQTPLSAIRLGELALEAGFPPGALNIVTGYGETAGAALVRHPGVNKIGFTGSTEVGRQIGRAALDNMTRFTLELGGKSPQIVLDDFEPEQINAGPAGMIDGCFHNQGQVCAAGTRLYVPKRKFDAIISRVSELVNAIKVGPGLDPTAEAGPVVSKEQQERVLGYIESGLQEGATLAAGGGSIDSPGYFIRPTVLVSTDNNIRAVQEEIFGPVLVAVPYDDLEDVIAKANDNAYGLTASIWSNNLTRVMELIPRIKAGTVWVNTHIPVDPNMPFGGYKQSGIGREHGKAMIDAYTELKSVMIAY